jgi:hypothetical protein
VKGKQNSTLIQCVMLENTELQFRMNLVVARACWMKLFRFLYFWQNIRERFIYTRLVLFFKNVSD